MAAASDALVERERSVAETVAQYVSLHVALEHQLRETDALFRPLRARALAELQNRLRRLDTRR